MKKCKTKHWVIHDAGDSSVDNLVQHPQIQEAIKWIKQNEAVAFPTETVYGLGANAMSDEAVRKIFEAKGRPSDNPLIVHIAAVDQVEEIVDNLNDLGRKLIDAFWPGPLTLVMKKKEAVCSLVSSNLPTVAVRMPDHPLALALIKGSHTPLAAPSANRSGKPSPTRAEHVLQDLDGRIVGVLDGGPTGVGLESTVVDVTGEMPVILRPGGVTLRQLEEIVGRVEVDPAIARYDAESSHEYQPKSPGMKYKHYAPDGELWIVDHRNGVERMWTTMQNKLHEFQEQNLKVGVLTTADADPLFSPAEIVIRLGSREEMGTIAKQIYDALREMDRHNVDIILSESFSAEGIGEAVMNRLLKAAGGRVIS